jgi:hypothetical protein
VSKEEQEMSRRRTVLCVAAGLALFCGTIALSAQAAANAPFLPGITVKDPYPNGCVDCHTGQGGKAPLVNAELANLSGHPKVDTIVKILPKDCLICHNGKGRAPQFNLAMHLVHFNKPAENAFVTAYKGACLNCHSLDASTGEMSVKSGPKNW